MKDKWLELERGLCPPREPSRTRGFGRALPGFSGAFPRDIIGIPPER